MKSKRKNVQDATLKNIRALQKRVSALEARTKCLERKIDGYIHKEMFGDTFVKMGKK